MVTIRKAQREVPNPITGRVTMVMGRGGRMEDNPKRTSEVDYYLDEADNTDLWDSLLLDDDETLLFADGYDDAIIGTAELKGGVTVAVYDIDKCLNVLMKRDAMTWAEAADFFEFNTLNAYVGEQTPIFVNMRRP